MHLKKTVLLHFTICEYKCLLFPRQLYRYQKGYKYKKDQHAIECVQFENFILN